VIFILNIGSYAAETNPWQEIYDNFGIQDHKLMMIVFVNKGVQKIIKK
jgi:hypothetical protein